MLSKGNCEPITFLRQDSMMRGVSPGQRPFRLYSGFFNVLLGSFIGFLPNQKKMKKTGDVLGRIVWLSLR